MDDADALETAKRIAFRAGRLALARLGEPGSLTWKGMRDVVPEAAVEVQSEIVSLLQRERPGEAVLAEEGPEDEALAVEADRLWIVDPICGSLNFVRGIPFFGISLALRVAGSLRRRDVRGARRGARDPERQAHYRGDRRPRSGVLGAGGRRGRSALRGAAARGSAPGLRAPFARGPLPLHPRLSRARPVLRGGRSPQRVLDARRSPVGRRGGRAHRAAGGRNGHGRRGRLVAPLGRHVRRGGCRLAPVGASRGQARAGAATEGRRPRTGDLIR